MKQTFLFGDTKISCTLKRYRQSKRVRLSVPHGRELLIMAPVSTPFYFIEKILRENEAWIHKTFQRYEEQTKPVLVKNERALYGKHKEEARDLVFRRLAFWNQQYNFSWGRVSIRNQKTRWGSCSKKGNLNFSYRLAFLSEKLSDYIIVHELCHLKQFNHSKAFWDLVSLAIPDHKERRKSLRGVSL